MRGRGHAGSTGIRWEVLEFPTILLFAGTSKVGDKGDRAEGQGLGVHSNMQSPAAPRRGCIWKSDTHINTPTRLHARMRRRRCMPGVGSPALGPEEPPERSQ